MNGRTLERNGCNFESAGISWERDPIWGLEPPSMIRPQEP